ncbi:hypothetical protein LXA47_19405 [Massilia sp. P8910]|uniref:hypothetical protein n=1 Tax=Massilia antarctica TaxID=2765360 RepID=UPI001E5FD5E9|nr:hypothetical protein [Massilia antarctica]MCE3605755.1 hypothetical protein [Massilia antarctica]
MLERILRVKSMTVEDMADALEISVNQARQYARLLLGEDGQPSRLYIADWNAYGQKRMRAVPLYGWRVTGQEVDAAKPPSEYITKAPRRDRSASAQVRQQIEPPAYKRDPLLGAIFNNRQRK